MHTCGDSNRDPGACPCGGHTSEWSAEVQNALDHASADLCMWTPIGSCREKGVSEVGFCAAHEAEVAHDGGTCKDDCRFCAHVHQSAPDELCREVHE